MLYSEMRIAVEVIVSPIPHPRRNCQNKNHPRNDIAALSKPAEAWTIPRIPIRRVKSPNP
jgi:hypothetical protein